MAAQLKLIQEGKEKESMDRQKALEAALAQIDKAFGKGSAMKLGSKEAMQVEAISTGSLGLVARRLADMGDGGGLGREADGVGVRVRLARAEGLDDGRAPRPGVGVADPERLDGVEARPRGRVGKPVLGRGELQGPAVSESRDWPR